LTGRDPCADNLVRVVKGVVLTDGGRSSLPARALCPFIAHHVGRLHLMPRPECLAVGQAVVQEASSPRQARWQSSLRNGISRRNGNHQEVLGLATRCNTSKLTISRCFYDYTVGWVVWCYVFCFSMDSSALAFKTSKACAVSRSPRLSPVGCILQPLLFVSFSKLCLGINIASCQQPG
jgi:hypothetical protein